MSDKKSTNTKPSKFWEILTKDYKYENLILVILSITVLVFGALIVAGSLNVNQSFPVIGKYPEVFAWSIIVIAVSALLFTAWPFFKPSIFEWKKTTKPTKAIMFDHIAKVFSFMLLLSILFALFDYLIGLVFRGLGIV